jgi:hypothetical protein
MLPSNIFNIYIKGIYEPGGAQVGGVHGHAQRIHVCVCVEVGNSLHDFLELK